MRSKERFLAALNGNQTDRVPVWDFINNPALYKDVLNMEPFFIDGHLAVRLYREIGLDGAFIPIGGYNALVDAHWEWFGNNQFRDEWGTIYVFEQGAWPCAFPSEFSVKTRLDWQNLKKPNPHDTWRYQTIHDAVKENRQEASREIAVVAGIRGPFSTASMILGLTPLSILLYDDQDFLNEILKTACEFWTTIGLNLARMGVDAIVIVDDMGANQYTLISPEHLRKMVLPLLKKEVLDIRKSGVPVFLHSCGNISSILPDIVETGVLGLNNIQQSAGMDIRKIKNRYGRKLCLIGNVNSSEVMSFGNPADVERAVMECISIASPGGGHILATDHSFHMGIPLKNVYTFIKAGKKMGIYGSGIL